MFSTLSTKEKGKWKRVGRQVNISAHVGLVGWGAGGIVWPVVRLLM
jgi:hypothetical protein